MNICLQRVRAIDINSTKLIRWRCGS